MRGKIGDQILKVNDYSTVSVVSRNRVDCSYIVTLGDSKFLDYTIDRVSKWSKHIIVLHTNTVDKKRCFTAKGVEFLRFNSDLHNQIFDLRSSHNPTTDWNFKFDVPSKRNFAINHARANCFQRILLIDDDIVFRDSFIPSGLKVLENGSDIACTYSLYHPDISTLDRIEARHLNHHPKVSISGNAFLLNTASDLGFFPFVYNEDWFFFWSSMHFGSAKITPFQTVVQRPPRSGRSKMVAMEQFGEILVKLMFECQQNPHLKYLQDMSLAEQMLSGYRNQLQTMLGWRRESDIIQIARNATEEITAEDIVFFGHRLQEDLNHHYDKK